MQQFTNKFSVAFNQDKSEAVINFFQESPVLPPLENGTVTLKLESEIAPVANLVMTGQTAAALASVLNNLLAQDRPPIPPETPVQ